MSFVLQYPGLLYKKKRKVIRLPKYSRDITKNTRTSRIGLLETLISHHVGLIPQSV